MLTKFSNLIRETSLLLPNATLQNNMLVHTAWKEIRGLDEETRKNTKIRMIKNDVLYISASNGIWAQEIQLKNDKILKEINKHIHKKTKFTLKQIVVFVGNIQ